MIEENKILKTETVICPALPQVLHNREGYLRVAGEFEEIIEEAKKNGLSLAYHNHSTEFEKYGEKIGLEIILEICPSLEVEIDTYWVQHGGGDPAFWIARYAGRISQVHFKDMGMKKDKQIMVPIGEGNLHWSGILKSCKKAGVKYCFVELDTSEIDPFESVKISLENMKGWGLTS